MTPDLPATDYRSTDGVPVSSDLAHAIDGAGWAALAFTSTAPPSEGTLWYTDPATGDGSLHCLVSASVHTVSMIISSGGAGATQQVRVDTRKLFDLRRHQLIITWSGSFMEAIIDGARDQEQQIADLFYAPALVRPSAVTRIHLGKNLDGSSYPGITIHEIAYGRGRLSGRQARALARRAGCAVDFVVDAIGDSITEFADGYHLTLATAMGNGPHGVVVANHGKGGDTGALVQARLHDAVDNAPDAAVVLVGTNDIWNTGHHSAWADVRQTYLDVVQRLKAAGCYVVACTIPPLNKAAADVTWVGWYTDGAAAQWAFANAEIRTLATQGLVDAVVDLDTVLDTDHDGQADAGLLYDGVHPTAATSVLIGQAIWSQGFASRTFTPTADSLELTVSIQSITCILDGVLSSDEPRQPIRIGKGETMIVAATVLNNDRTPHDLATDTLYFAFRALGAPAPAHQYVGVTQGDSAAGLSYFKVLAADTADINVRAQDFLCDVFLVDVDGNASRIWSQRFFIDESAVAIP